MHELTWAQRVYQQGSIVQESRWVSPHQAFCEGAAWQRDQLLTDDVIERAAMAILLRNYPSYTLDEARRFAGAGELDDARNKARTALTAAIGDPE